MPSEASLPQLQFDQGTLLLRCTPESAEAVRAALQAGTLLANWVWDNRMFAWRCDAYHYRTAIAELRAALPALQNQLPQWERIDWPQITLPTLRAEQQEAVERWWSDRQGVITMPTGTGKTEVALALMAAARVSTLVVAPVRDLMYQWHRRIWHALGYDAGVIGDQLYQVRPVSVTTYDSACIHMPRLGARFGLVIFDECHHLPGPMRSDAARMSAAPFRLGLTATLERSDGRHTKLADWIGPTVYELPLERVKGSTLADYHIFRIPVFLQPHEQARYDELAQRIQTFMAQCRQENPAITWQDICAMSGDNPLARAAQREFRMKQAIEDRAEEKLRVLEDLFRLHVGVPMLVFAGSNAMARAVSTRFLIPCLLSHCRKAERLDALDGLAAGRYPAIVANQVLDEGVDIPAVKVAVVLGGSASTRQSRQRLGRILRRTDHTHAILYEVVCANTRDVQRSRQRRKDDAFQGTRRRPM